MVSVVMPRNSMPVRGTTCSNRYIAGQSYFTEAISGSKVGDLIVLVVIPIPNMLDVVTGI